METNNTVKKPNIIAWAWKSIISIIIIISLYAVLSNSFFYAEPGYIYHVRTVTGSEQVITEAGYKFYPFGRYNAWKRAMTVQANSSRAQINAEQDGNTSASIPPLNIVFLDQVDADAQATVRFSIPTDVDSFLQLAHEYRTPENLLQTALIPSFKETLQATASLMSAEDFYSGGRTQFAREFENQMTRGIYIVERQESQELIKSSSGSANAALGTDQEQYGETTKTVTKVVRLKDVNGIELRKPQNFIDFGISIVDARITEMQPNTKFKERMELKQKASADRAIAREQRIQEEEQRLLAIARGEREVAERQAEAKVDQIQKTTEALTEKQLAITKAEKEKEQAIIQKAIAQENLERARIEAQTQVTLADAEAYAKRQILEADNALQQKLDAEIAIQGLWAEAFSKRAVPTNVFGSNGNTPTGSDSETTAFMQMLTLDAAKRLSYDRKIEK